MDIGEPQRVIEVVPLRQPEPEPAGPEPEPVDPTPEPARD